MKDYYKEQDYDNESCPDNFCRLCCDDYAEENKVKVLTCEHSFHNTCIDTFLIIKNECPKCLITLL